MSISSVGNSDAYARYRQQALNLVVSPSQAKTQASQTTAPSIGTSPDTTEQSSSNPFATKFSADLSALNSTDRKSQAHGAHGQHHKADAAADATSATDSSANASADPIQQSLDEFANLLKTAAGIAAVIA